LFAPTRLYGCPDDLRAFVDDAHALGLGVILDVVYNHFGPDGNHLGQFSPAYFTDRYENEWGRAINFDGEDSGPVRELFIENARYWISEYHFDGLRLDATQQICDHSPEHVLRAIRRAVDDGANGRKTLVVAENEPQHAHLARPIERGGHGIEMLYNDDFHHSARVAATGRTEAYFSNHCGSAQELISAVKHGFLFQGQWYEWQKQPRGEPALDLESYAFLHFLQNHDQIANSSRGRRLHQLTSPGRMRALTALLLLAPATPMLFQGQEFAASSPFQYFADHGPELGAKVAAGRREFLQQFPSSLDPALPECPDDPRAMETFVRCKLDLRDAELNAPVYRLHQDLLRLRREDPVFRRQRRDRVDGAVLAQQAFVLRFFGEVGDDRLLFVNLGRDSPLLPCAEPLLAPPARRGWTVQWSSERLDYDGCGVRPLDTPGVWALTSESALVLRAVGV
jgi:maltooligosyltrehalose trehalohydrolase